MSLISITCQNKFNAKYNKTMKTKHIYILVALLITILFFGCDNEIDAPPTPTYKATETNDYTLAETFENGFGNFVTINVQGEAGWAYSKYKYIMMDGKTNAEGKANEDWVISAPVTLPSTSTSVISFDYAARNFSNIVSGFTIWLSEDYNPSVKTINGIWKQINPTEPLKNTVDWNMINSGDISLKAYKGKKVFVALKYVSTESNSGILQVKNLIIKDRKPVTLPFSELFLTSKGKFVTINVLGDQEWGMDRTYIKMSGFVGSSNLANEDWLISPQIDLTKVTTAKLSFDHVVRYFTNPKIDATVWVSRNYEEGSPSSATWSLIKTPLPFSNASSWDFQNSGEINLTEYAGDTITVALKYLSTSAKAGTWEVRNFLVKEGVPSDFIFVEAFDETLGKFTTDSKVGAQTWRVDASNKYALMSGFANSKSNANEDWLISPSIDLTGKTDVKITFDHTINKGALANLQTNHTLWLSANDGASWEQVSIPTYPNGANWTFVNAGNIVVPAKFTGIKTFKFAFKYLCSDIESASWEIKNVIVKQ